MFQIQDSEAKLAEEVSGTYGEPLPNHFSREPLPWQKALRIACLPPQRVFLRVVELPPCSSEEIRSMLELQIDVLSPLPASEVLWSYAELPTNPAKGRRVLLVIVPAQQLQHAIAQCEELGFAPDRVDFPCLMPLLDPPSSPDLVRVWLWPADKVQVLICGFWNKGELVFSMLAVFSQLSESVALIQGLFQQAVWAGEIEGWLPHMPRWQLICRAEDLDLLKDALVRIVGGEIEFEPLPEIKTLAGRTAAACWQLNLLPPEKQQQLLARRRRRALIFLGEAILLAYLVVIIALLAVSNVRQFRVDSLRQRVRFLQDAYTNAIALKAQVDLLRRQSSLRFSALECLRVVSSYLPPEMQLEQFRFQEGNLLVLFGTVPADRQERVTAFNETLSKAEVNGRRLFRSVTTKSIRQVGSGPASWQIECELASGP